MNQAEKEQMRDAVLAALYRHMPSKMTLPAVNLALRRKGFDCADNDDILNALAFLEGFGHVESAPHPLGATRVYSLAPQGVLYAERNGIAE